jgi:hypothetical protein
MVNNNNNNNNNNAVLYYRAGTTAVRPITETAKFLVRKT